MATNVRTRRLMKELSTIRKDAALGTLDPILTLEPVSDSLDTWTATIKGPDDSAYSGFVFKLSINIPSQYPMTPPEVRFVTKIFHCNVHFSSHEICLDILKSTWTPAWSLQHVVRAIHLLMGAPEPDSPLNCDAGNLLRAGDKRAHDSMVRLICSRYAERLQPEK
ncbi:Ubiquitin-conjugating enzyme [Carpediemonas membranifera]|uniref:Ubiquitin-conjugating enzyme n=1 Tax=Carpediemonas membranifera TaxID=201153 RepID=A0A8J6ASB4_9EUKA|nr:Ubiquitin-conjugating enzyme [Carpediemonas membranifera]|eukprot:KAG9391070.1 Ubiquitin-conjugating enzyme [Carpediemonas membranifera]